MAASIPILRVLIKEVKSTASRRFGSRGNHSFHSKSLDSISATQFKTVVASESSKDRIEITTSNYSRPASEVNALGKSTVKGAQIGGGARILQSREITIHYHDKETGRDLEMGNAI